MKILVVGGGGREHAIAWQLAKSGHTVLVAPGNPGIAEVASCHPIEVGDLDGLEELVSRESCDLVIIGPEAPLVAGLADRLRARDVCVFGPSAQAAQLEASKSFGKRFFARHGIRSADFRECTTVAEARVAIADLGERVVVKADGLAAGKGVVVCSTAAQAEEAARDMLDGRFGDAGKSIVIEKRLEGRELSVMAITDGKRYELLAQAEDHKAVFDGDQGPNTGGMGTVSPASWVAPALIERVRREIFDKTIAGLAADGIDFRGVLYAGLMLTSSGEPWILEYNVRFGDPETQPVMRRLKSDLAQWLVGAARGELPAQTMQWDDRCAVCIVLAARGYPDRPILGDPIDGIEDVQALPEVLVFHAGTRRERQRIVTAGGRVLGVTSLGASVASARQSAYAAVRSIRFDGMHYRTDIGARGEK